MTWVVVKLLRRKCNSEILYYSSFPLQKNHKDISHECTRIAFMTRIQCQRFSWPLYSRPSLTQLFRFMSLNFLHHYYIVTVKLSHVSCPCQNLRQVNQNIYIFFSSVLYEHQRTVYWKCKDSKSSPFSDAIHSWHFSCNNVIMCDDNNNIMITCV